MHFRPPHFIVQVVILYCLLWSFTPLKAQLAIQLKIPVNKVNQEGRSLLKVDCEIYNPTQENIENLELAFEVKANIRALSPILMKINLSKDSLQKRRFKFILEHTAEEEDSLLIISYLRSFGTTTVLAKDSIWLPTKPPMRVYIKPLRRSVIVEEGKANLSLAISNPNDRPISAKIALYNPPNHIKNSGLTKVVKLPSQKDTIIDFPVVVMENDRVSDETPLYLAVAPLEGKRFGLIHFSLLQLKSKKQHIPVGKKPNFYESMEMDFYTGKFNKNMSLAYTGAGYFEGNEMEFSVRPTYFFNRQQLSLYNTFYRFENEAYEWRLGDFQYRDELYLNGKAIAFDRKTEKGAVGIAVVNSHQDILSFVNNRDTPAKNSIRLHYDKSLKSNWNWTNILTNQSTPNSRITIAETGIRRENIRKSTWFNFAAGLNNLIANEQQIGIAFRGNYVKKTGQWRVKSKNYFSTNNFPGLLGGQKQFLQNISYLGWQKWRTALLVNLNHFSSRNQFVSSFSKARLTDWRLIEWQFKRVVNTKFNIWIAPNFLQQKMIQSADSQEVRKYVSNAQRLKFGIQKELNVFNFDVNIDAGFYNSFSEQEQRAHRFSLRSNAAINYNQSSLLFFYNHGPFYLFEEIQLDNFGGGQAYFSGMFKQRIVFLGNRLKMQLSAQYIYNQTRQRWNENYRVRLTTNVIRNWALTAEVNVLKTKAYINPIYNIGIRKRINQYRNFKKDKKLFISTFVKDNKTRQQSKEEEQIEGLVVKVGNETMITNKKGQIKLKGLPATTYELRITDPKGKFAEIRQEVNLKQKESYQIGLIPSFTIRGKINLKREKFSDDRVSSGGVKILLLGLEGQKYETYTGIDGRYIFSIPQGSYYVQIIDAFKDSRFKILDNFQKISSDEFLKDKEINFEVTVRSRKTKVKNFNKKK